MIIRNAKISDLPAIVEIYNQAILTKTATADLTPIEADSKLLWFKEHDPDKYPIFVSEIDNQVIGWISLSPYRFGREALRFTAEVSYYIHSEHKRKGNATYLMDFILKECPKYQIKTLFAIILEHNFASINLVKKFNFEKWGFLPCVADFDGKEYGHLYYGLRVQLRDQIPI